VDQPGGVVAVGVAATQPEDTLPQQLDRLVLDLARFPGVVETGGRRAVRPSWVSRALNSTKPPSVLASGRSKRATAGFTNPSPWKVTWVIQSVAIEPPLVRASKRVDTASIAPASGSVALLFHLS
jgi:hypothetical protein